jgi:hypothetical protein
VSLIWFIVWMVNGHPWLLSEWNPWNISLLVCAALDVLGSSGARGAAVGRRHGVAQS